MALSVPPIGAYTSTIAIQPLHYAVKNRSEVSAGYTESLKANGGIKAVPPVRYPNAREMQTEAPATAQNSKAATERMYNEVASRFQGMTTGYTGDSTGYGYDQIGSHIDLFA